MKSRSIRTLAPALILIGATLAAPATSAAAPAKHRVFAPSSRSDGALVFHLRGVTPRSVRAGYLRLRGRHHTVRTETLRAGVRKGRLKVRIPASAQGVAEPKAEPRLVVLVKGGKPGSCVQHLRRVSRTRRLRRRLLARRLLAPLRGRLALQPAPLPPARGSIRGPTPSCGA